jgi:anti-anti-sigma regulatory factor
MPTALSDSRHTPLNRDWSLGAVLAALEIDEHTCVVRIRADVAAGASISLERQLLALRLAGFTTVIVDVGETPHVTDAIVAALMRSRRELAARDGRLVLAAEARAVRRALARAGLEVAEPDGVA